MPQTKHGPGSLQVHGHHPRKRQNQGASESSSENVSQGPETTTRTVTMTYESDQPTPSLPQTLVSRSGSSVSGMVTTTTFIFVQPFPTTLVKTTTYTPNLQSSTASSTTESAAQGNGKGLSKPEIQALSGSVAGGVVILIIGVVWFLRYRSRRNIRETVPSSKVFRQPNCGRECAEVSSSVMTLSRRDPLLSDKTRDQRPGDYVTRPRRTWLDIKRQGDFIAKQGLALPPSPVSPVSPHAAKSSHSSFEDELSPQDYEPLRFRPL